MKKPLVRIYSANSEFIDREMNDEEFTQWQIDQENVATRKAEEEAKEIQRQAILDRLGLTADEAKLILG
jgi:hypothetical protein